MSKIIYKFYHITLLFLASTFLFFGLGNSAYGSEGNFKKIWEYESDYWDPFNTVQSQPKEYKGMLFLVDGLGNLIALSKDTGDVIYKEYIGKNAGRRGFAIDKDQDQLVITAQAQLFIIDVNTGEKLKAVTTEKAFAAPIVTPECYIILSIYGIVQCHDRQLTFVKWRTNLGKTARVWSNALWIKKYNMV